MKSVQAAKTRCSGVALRLVVRAQADRGDVPGWVLVTVMTAGLVTAIWMIADEQLKAVLARAMSSLGTR